MYVEYIEKAQFSLDIINMEGHTLTEVKWYRQWGGRLNTHTHTHVYIYKEFYLE